MVMMAAVVVVQLPSFSEYKVKVTVATTTAATKIGMVVVFRATTCS